MQKIKDKVTFKGDPVTLVGNPIAEGDKAPDFTVLDNGLNPRNLSDYDGKVRILSVFPSIDTSVCNKQNKRFNEEAAGLDENIVIPAISVDLPFALSRFCDAEGIDKVKTLSDHKDLDFGTKYGFLIEELRLLARGVVIVDKDNIVRYVEYVPEIGEEPDYNAALKAAQKLV